MDESLGLATPQKYTSLLLWLERLKEDKAATSRKYIRVKNLDLEIHGWVGRKAPSFSIYNYSSDTTAHKKEANSVHREAEHEGHITKKNDENKRRRTRGWSTGKRIREELNRSIWN